MNKSEMTEDVMTYTREELSELLGQKELVSVEVYHAALHHNTYLQNLITTKDTPAFLQHLLDNPPTVEVSEDGEGAKETEVTKKSNLALMSKASKSLAKWSKAKFKTVDNSVYEARFEACMGCEHFQDPPSKVLYKITTATKKDKNDRKICGSCGCVISNKARLPHENCPLPHKEVEGMSRWMEPMTPKT